MERICIVTAVFFALLTPTGVQGLPLDIYLSERFVLAGFPGEGNFARVSDVAYDMERGLILVTDEGRKRIYEFRSDGAPENVLGGEADIPFIDEIAAGTGGRLFLLESSTGRVFTMDRVEKEEITPLEGKKENPEGIFARGITTSRAGTLYLVDLEGKHLNIRDRDGALLTSTKSRQRLKELVAMDIDSRGRVLVATREMNPLHLFDSSGEYSRRVEIRDFTTNLPLSDIGGAAFDQQGRIWVSYPRDGLVRVFDETGAMVSELGKASVPGGLFSPTDLEITPMGDVLILERGYNRIRSFNVDIR